LPNLYKVNRIEYSRQTNTPHATTQNPDSLRFRLCSSMKGKRSLSAFLASQDTLPSTTNCLSSRGKGSKATTPEFFRYEIVLQLMQLFPQNDAIIASLRWTWNSHDIEELISSRKSDRSHNPKTQIQAYCVYR